MDIKKWLSQHNHVATSIFHSGRYCKDWKASSFEMGMPSFHAILEGKCWVNFPDSSRTLPLHEGDIVFFFFNMPFYLTSSHMVNISEIPKKVMYPLSEPVEGDTAIICGFLHSRSLEADLLFALLPEYIIVSNKEEDSNKIKKLIEMLKFEGVRECEIALTKITDLLLLYTLDFIVDDNLVDVNLLNLSKNKKFAELIVDIINNPSYNWSIENMAKKTNMSRSTFIRKLNEMSGYNPNDLVTRLRIKIAVDLLRRGCNTENIAEKIGYKSVAGFYKAFKRVTNRTPTDFCKGIY